MQQLLKEYHDAKLAKYKTRMDERGAIIAAKYALDDMVTTVKKNMDIYKDENTALEILKMEIEDAA
jgi:hypothetical protein